MLLGWLAPNWNNMEAMHGIYIFFSPNYHQQVLLAVVCSTLGRKIVFSKRTIQWIIFYQNGKKKKKTKKALDFRVLPNFTFIFFFFYLAWLVIYLYVVCRRRSMMRQTIMKIYNITCRGSSRILLEFFPCSHRDSYANCFIQHELVPQQLKFTQPDQLSLNKSYHSWIEWDM